MSQRLHVSQFPSCQWSWALRSSLSKLISSLPDAPMTLRRTSRLPGSLKFYICSSSLLLKLQLSLWPDTVSTICCGNVKKLFYVLFLSISFAFLFLLRIPTRFSSDYYFFKIFSRTPVLYSHWQFKKSPTIFSRLQVM